MSIVARNIVDTLWFMQILRSPFTRPDTALIFQWLLIWGDEIERERSNKFYVFYTVYNMPSLPPRRKFLIHRIGPVTNRKMPIISGTPEQGVSPDDTRLILFPLYSTSIILSKDISICPTIWWIVIENDVLYWSASKVNVRPRPKYRLFKALSSLSQSSSFSFITNCCKRYKIRRSNCRSDKGYCNYCPSISFCKVSSSCWGDSCGGTASNVLVDSASLENSGGGGNSDSGGGGGGDDSVGGNGRTVVAALAVSDTVVGGASWCDGSLAVCSRIVEGLLLRWVSPQLRATVLLKFLLT